MMPSITDEAQVKNSGIYRKYFRSMSESTFKGCVDRSADGNALLKIWPMKEKVISLVDYVPALVRNATEESISICLLGRIIMLQPSEISANLNKSVTELNRVENNIEVH